MHARGFTHASGRSGNLAQVRVREDGWVGTGFFFLFLSTAAVPGGICMGGVRGNPQAQHTQHTKHIAFTQAS